MSEEQPARTAKVSGPPSDEFKEFILEAVRKATEHHKAVCPEEHVDAETFSAIPLGCAAAIQHELLKNAGSLPRESHAQMSQAITLLVAAINTMSHNPLYGSYAIFDQFKHHVEQLINNAKAIEIVEARDD